MKHKNDKTKAAVYSYVNSLLWHRKTKYHVNMLQRNWSSVPVGLYAPSFRHNLVHRCRTDAGHWTPDDTRHVSV